MTRNDTKKILMNIECSYPNWKPNGDLGFMVDIWTDDLADYSYEQVYMALKTFKATDKSGFAPSVGQLIDKIHSSNEIQTEETDSAVWSKVMKAICNSSYNASAEFEKLDDISKAVIGSPEELRSMATNEEFNEGVEKSLFMKNYKERKNLQKEINRMPSDVKQSIGIGVDNKIGIEVK